MGADRIKELRAAADVTIYTPGSTAGVPLNVVGSLRAPKLSWDTEAETLRDEIEGLVAEPARARRDRRRAAVEPRARLARQPDRERLAGGPRPRPRLSDRRDPDAASAQAGRVRDRRLLPAQGPHRARPQAQRARRRRRRSKPGEKGRRSTSQSLLCTPEGKPRAAIVYLAHLSDEERQFVVTLVLSKLVTWMRGQPARRISACSSYMDEVFGFVPPTAAPPAKKPILTILKQGRAFGVGIVLATQNPVDLDYKAMSNAGTWLVGRLQTEHDKARVLEGLRSAAGGTDVAALDATIGGLEKRQFLLVSSKSSQPQSFATRWAMSYLRGPLTKDQVASLMKDVPRAAEAPPDAAPEPTARAAPEAATGTAAPAPEAAAPPSDAETPVAPAAPSGVPVSVPRPGRSVGVVRRRRRGRHAPAGIRGRTSRSALRRHDRRNRRGAGVRGALRPARRRPRPRPGDRRRLRRPRPRRPTACGGDLRSPGGSDRAGVVLQGRRDRDQATAGRQARARDLHATRR